MHSYNRYGHLWCWWSNAAVRADRQCVCVCTSFFNLFFGVKHLFTMWEVWGKSPHFKLLRSCLRLDSVCVCVSVCVVELSCWQWCNMTLAGTCWAERTWNRAFPDMSSRWRNHLCECEAGSDVLMAYQTSKGDLCGGSWRRETSVGVWRAQWGCLEVDKVEIGGREVGAQSHVWVLQLSQDPSVKLGADSVKLHDVAGILLNPEAVELLHQVTCQERK